MKIDAHVHLWKKQTGTVGGKPVFGIGGGKSDFGGEIRQMMPPYLDCENTVETLLQNMDYAGVAAAVVTQEYIDGNQDEYLLEVRQKYPNRFRVCGLYEGQQTADSRFDGIKVPAQRLNNPDLKPLIPLMRDIEKKGMFLSVDLLEGDRQTGSLEEIIRECPNLRIAIGHFGMVSRGHWEAQIKLARYPNVRIESGGITWLFHREFYPYPSAAEAIRRAAEICGMEKLMWGSDYPRTMTEITYKMSYNFLEKSNLFTNDEKNMFWGENATRFYGFNDISTPPKIKNMLED